MVINHDEPGIPFSCARSKDNKISLYPRYSLARLVSSFTLSDNLRD